MSESVVGAGSEARGAAHWGSQRCPGDLEGKHNGGHQALALFQRESVAGKGVWGAPKALYGADYSFGN